MTKIRTLYDGYMITFLVMKDEAKTYICVRLSGPSILMHFEEQKRWPRDTFRAQDFCFALPEFAMGYHERTSRILLVASEKSRTRPSFSFV